MKVAMMPLDKGGNDALEDEGGNDDLDKGDNDAPDEGNNDDPNEIETDLVKKTQNDMINDDSLMALLEAATNIQEKDSLLQDDNSQISNEINPRDESLERNIEDNVSLENPANQNIGEEETEIRNETENTRIQMKDL